MTSKESSSQEKSSSSPIPSLFNCDVVQEMDGAPWQAIQVFYTAEPPQIQDVDEITAASFSKCGDHVAIGDKGGRIWIYSTDNGRSKCKPTSQPKFFKPFNLFLNNNIENDTKLNIELDEENMDTILDNNNKSQQQTELYDFYGQFQSHQPEFDYLKSLEIEEKINSISWCKTGMNYLTLLAANGKTIKLWKVFEKSILKNNKLRNNRLKNNNKLIVPNIEQEDVITAAISRRMYSDGHKFHIHSLDVSADCETFISCDDLRINLWHFDNPSSHYLLCDLKPDDMETLTETITSAFLHPINCGIMAYCTSRGNSILCDMRSNAKLDGINECTIFEYKRNELSRNFYGDIGISIRDGCFSNVNGIEYIITRDYFNSYVWDLRLSNKPLKIVPILPYVESDLIHLYESDILFDGFTVASSNESHCLVSGSYRNEFVIADWQNNCVQKCSLDPRLVLNLNNSNNSNNSNNNNNKKKQNNNNKNTKDTKETINNNIINNINNKVLLTNSVIRKPEWLKHSLTNNGKIKLENKVGHVLWHPQKELIAAVSGTALYVFKNQRENY